MVGEEPHRSSQWRGAVFHVNSSNGFIYRHSCLIWIFLGARQNRHFPARSPFSLRHVLPHTLGSILRRCYWGAAPCPVGWPRALQMGQRIMQTKEQAEEKVSFPTCDIHCLPWKFPSFPQEKTGLCDPGGGWQCSKYKWWRSCHLIFLYHGLGIIIILIFFPIFFFFLKFLIVFLFGPPCSIGVPRSGIRPKL